MKQIAIRVLWPQLQQDVSRWQCEVCEFPVLESEQELTVMTMAEAFQQAATRQLGEIGLDVTVLLPGELTLLDCVQLPARGQRQALQALPFVVEEQLADEIEKTHLAVGLRRPDGRWPVIVVDLAIMESLLACSEQNKLRVKAVYVDAQLLPVPEAHLSILMHGERVLFHSSRSVAVFDRELAASMIHFLTGDSIVSHVNIRYQRDDEQQHLLAQQLSTEFSALGETQVAMDATNLPLPALLLPVTHASAINLLQGRFVVRQASGSFQWWQIAAAVVMFAWLGQLGLQIGSGWYFNHGTTAMEILAENQYKKLFPNAKHVSSPRKRLESRLASDGESSSGDSFASIFGGSVQALNAMPDREGFSVEQLRYESKRGQLELELTAKSIDQLDQYKQELSKIGLSSRISSANDSEGHISGRMQIGKGV
jgi:general secretion pathway protein L